MAHRSNLAVELAREGDIAALLAIYNHAAGHGHATFATEPEPLGDWLDAWAVTREMYPWLVAVEGDAVVGYAKAAPHKPRGAYRWTTDLSVYLAPGAVGRGVGTALYRRLLPTLRAQGFVTLLAGIALPNPASVRLHERAGFVRCGTYHRAGWKRGAWHDVGYWELSFPVPAGPPAPLRPVAAVWPTRSPSTAR